LGGLPVAGVVALERKRELEKALRAAHTCFSGLWGRCLMGHRSSGVYFNITMSTQSLFFSTWEKSGHIFYYFTNFFFLESACKFSATKHPMLHGTFLIFQKVENETYTFSSQRVCYL
jgi:hypothetical protein